MLKPIFKITFVTFVWRQYKHSIVSTLLLFIFMWLVGRIHHDYLNYVNLHGNGGSLGWSFVVKWLALIGSVCLYLAYHIFWRPDPKKKKDKKPSKQADQQQNANNKPDPFNHLRHDDNLRTKGDLMIDKYLDKTNKKD